MHNPWHEEMAVIRALHAEHGDQTGRAPWQSYLIAAAAIFWPSLIYVLVR
jgi:hypothetical protein